MDFFPLRGRGSREQALSSSRDGSAVSNDFAHRSAQKSPPSPDSEGIRLAVGKLCFPTTKRPLVHFVHSWVQCLTYRHRTVRTHRSGLWPFLGQFVIDLDNTLKVVIGHQPGILHSE